MCGVETVGVLVRWSGPIAGLLMRLYKKSCCTWRSSYAVQEATVYGISQLRRRPHHWRQGSRSWLSRSCVAVLLLPTVQLCRVQCPTPHACPVKRRVPFPFTADIEARVWTGHPTGVTLTLSAEDCKAYANGCAAPHMRQQGESRQQRTLLTPVCSN